jgi:Tfp pilus assembly protein PilF
MNLEFPTNAAATPYSTDGPVGSGFGRDISAKAFKDYLVYLFLLGLIVRAAFLVEHSRNPSFGVATLDQEFYDTAARMILSGADLHPLQGLRPLLYPMFLAVCYKLGGAHGIDLAVVMQHILGVLTGVLAGLLGARLFRHRLAGLACGLLYLLAPVPLYLEGELLVEATYTFLICLSLLLVFHAAGVDGWKGGLFWLLCGGVTVLAAQERSNILVFMAVYPFLAGWRWWRSRQCAALWPLLGLIGGLLMGIPWGFVNKMQSGYFQFMPSAGGVNLYMGNRRTADGMVLVLDGYVKYDDRDEDPVEAWAREGYQKAMRSQGRQPENNPMAISKYWTARAVAEIKADPAAWLRLMAKKSWLMLWNTEVPNNKDFAFLQTEYISMRLLPVRWVVLFMLAPAGIWAAAKWGNREALFILLVYVLLYAAANVAFFIYDRFRYPLWPVMAAIAGGGLLAFVETIRQRRWSGVLWIAAGMAFMAAISVPNWFGAKLPSFALDYRLRSIAWYEKGNYAEALSDIDRSLELDPGQMTSLHHRGNVLLALNRLDEAKQDFERTLKISPQDGGLWNNYGVALDGLGLTNEALRAYRRATQCDPPSQSAFLGLAFDQIRSGRLDDAARTLDQLDKLQPGPNAAVLGLRSVLARQRGDAAQADALEQQARGLDASAANWAIDRATNGGARTP